MVLLGVEDEAELISWFGIMDEYRQNPVLFREPDIGNQATAFTVLPGNPKIIGGLKLLPTETNGNHYQGDCFDAIKHLKPDFLGCHPPCRRR